MGSLLDKYRSISVVLSAKASAKIDRLILSQRMEVGFYGVVEQRVNSLGLSLVVTDILVYPQIVSPASVTTDDMEMVDFYVRHSDSVNKIRYHGHSHVTMATVPSGVDIQHMKELTGNLKKEEDFYIFQIFNKSDDISSIVYIDGGFYRVPCVREMYDQIDFSMIRHSPSIVKISI